MISRHSSSAMSGSFGFFGRPNSFCRVSNSNLMASAEKTESASEAMGLNSDSIDARSTCTSFFGCDMSSPRLFVGTADGKGGAAPVNANTQPGQLLREVWQIVRDGFARDGLAILGDAVAAVALFCMVGLGLFLGAGMGLQ